MRIAICAERLSTLEHIIMQLEAIDFHGEMVSFLKISDLFKKIGKGSNFNAVLMDIEWKGERNGIDFASELFILSPKTKIIFTADHSERYSQQIFLKNINLSGFIAKPIDPGILLKNLEKVKEKIMLKENRKFTLKFNGKIIVIDPDNILYIESCSHTAMVCAADGVHLCYEKLSVLLRRLPIQFVFTHKSFLVNMDKIRCIERGRVTLENDIKIPISKSRQKEVKENYFRYAGDIKI